MKHKNSGFGYYVSLKRIREYQRIPIEMRLAWLYHGNLLRKAYPKKIVELQDKFREGKL